MNLFPRFEMPRKLYVYDGSGDNNEVRLLLATLQGVVNRDDPRIYLIFNSWPEGMKSDDKWLDYYSVRDIEIKRVKSVPEIVRMFAGELSGFIIYDPELLDTANIATTMAGLENAIVVHPDIVGLVKGAGLKMKDDLRGRWAGKYAGYRWALDELWAGCNYRILGSMPYSTDKLYGIEVRDYLVAVRAFVFNLTPDKEENRFQSIELFNEILSLAEEQSTILGWITTFPTEREYVGEISKRGHHVLCTTMCPNLTVHAGIAAGKQFCRRKVIKPGKKLEKKIYVSLRISDGDSPAVLLKWHSGHWLDKNRGSMPLGWEVQPLMLELAPTVMEYYYKTATENDCLLCGVSGAGYCHPSELPNLKLFLERTRTLMKQCDLRLVQVADRDIDTAKAIFDEAVLGEYLGSTGADGIFTCGAGNISVLGEQLVVPTPLVWTSCSKIKNYLERANSDNGTPKFFSFLLSCYTLKDEGGLKKVEELINSVPSNKYEFVRPDELIWLIRQAIKEGLLTDYHRIDRSSGKRKLFTWEEA